MVINKKIIASMIVASLGAITLSSSQAATNTGAANVTIAAAMTIGAASPVLSFGTLAPSTAGTATVLGTNAISVTGGTTVAGGTATAAQFAVTGTGTAAYLIDTSASSTTLTGVGPAMGIVYTAYSFNADNTYATAYAAPANLVASADTIRVGGVLTVGTTAAQTAGAYTGTVSVTVLYQ